LSFVYLRDATETLTKRYQLAKVGQIGSPLELSRRLGFFLTIELKSVLCRYSLLSPWKGGDASVLQNRFGKFADTELYIAIIGFLATTSRVVPNGRGVSVVA
jgi:hypothetical protein